MTLIPTSKKEKKLSLFKNKVNLQDTLYLPMSSFFLIHRWKETVMNIEILLGTFLVFQQGHGVVIMVE